MGFMNAINQPDDNRPKNPPPPPPPLHKPGHVPMPILKELLELREKIGKLEGMMEVILRQ